MLDRLLPSRGREERLVRDPGWARWGNGDDLPVDAASTGGQRVTPRSAMNLLAVYGAAGLIADMIATLPVEVQRDVAGTTVAAPTPPWVERPNLEVDRVGFLTQIVLSLLLDGNAFLAPVLDGDRVVEVHALDPSRVHVTRSSGARPVYTVDNEPVRDPLIHVPALLLAGSLRGLSPVEAARQIIGIGLGGTEQAARFYAQGSIVPGVIETAADLSIEQMREIRDQWLASHGGSRRSHLPVVLGAAKYAPISVTPEQAQFLESRRYTDAQIAGQLFRLDPSFLGIAVEGAGLLYQNIEHRQTHLVRVTLMPWLIRVERALSSLLPDGTRFRFNVDGMLRADLTTRYQSYKTASEIGLLTIDEMRALEDRPPLDAGSGGDEATSARGIAELIQKIYLGVGTVLTSEEAREIANRAGAGFDIPGPNFVEPEPSRSSLVDEVRAAMADLRPVERSNDTHIHLPDSLQVELRQDPIVVPAPIVNVPAAQVTVNVEPTPVTVNVAPAEVNVAAPAVHVSSPDVVVNVPAAKPSDQTITVLRDRNGRIIGAQKTEVVDG